MTLLRDQGKNGPRDSRDPRVPPFLPPPDLDYEAAFNCLLDVEEEILRLGPSKERLLRRGLARFTLGDYLSAAFDGEEALRLDHDSLEAEFLQGQAFLALAAFKHGVARPGLGTDLRRDGLPPRRSLLLAAQRGFARVLACRPDDQQARKSLKSAQALLADLANPRPRAATC